MPLSKSQVEQLSAAIDKSLASPKRINNASGIGHFIQGIKALCVAAEDARWNQKDANRIRKDFLANYKIENEIPAFQKRGQELLVLAETSSWTPDKVKLIMEKYEELFQPEISAQEKELQNLRREFGRK